MESTFEVGVDVTGLSYCGDVGMIHVIVGLQRVAVSQAASVCRDPHSPDLDSGCLPNMGIDGYIFWTWVFVHSMVVP